MATNTKTKEIQFDYFQVCCFEIIKDENTAKEKLLDISEILKKAQGLKTVETMKPFRGDKARIQVVNKDKKTGIWELQILRLRESNPPGIATDAGDFTIFELEDGNYIGESTTALYDSKDSIFVMQRNRDSFTPSGMQEYLNEIIKKTEDLLFFKTILSGKKINSIKKDKIFRKIQIGVTTEDFLKNGNKESSLFGLLGDAPKFGSNKIKIELSLGNTKKSESLDQALSYDIIHELYNKKYTDQLKVGYKDNEETKVEYVDLLDDRRSDKINIIIDKKKPFTHNDIYPEINKIYLKRKKEKKIF